MEVIFSGRSNSGRPPQAEALQAVRIAEASGLEPIMLAYHPVANVNPYQALTYRRFGESGIGVLPLYDREWAGSLASLRSFGVRVALHLHWTSWVLDGAVSELDAQERVHDAIGWLDELRKAGIALIWSLHNILPHDVVYREAQVRLQQWLVDNADVVHVLNGHTVDATAHLLTIQPAKVLHGPHPNYRGAYPDFLSREQARGMLGLDPDEIVYVMVGAIKAYKGISRLLPALDQLPTDPPRRLLVAGKADSSVAAEQFVAECRRHARVLIDNRTVPEGDMQIYLRAADVAVLPYQQTLNSGAALLALSFGLPVVAPAVGDLAETLTEDCAELFDPGQVDGFQAALTRSDRLLGPDARLAAVARAEQFDPDVLSRALARELRRRLAA
jgi:glycosyltransferase involved in cell wall biosynthesis